MNPIYILLFAIFSNFFGWFIVNSYCTYLQMFCANKVFTDTYFEQSILELCVVFFFIFIISLIYIKKEKKIVKNQSDFYFFRGYMYWVLTFLLFLNMIYTFFNINFNFDTSLRGVGQFDRDITSALSRFSILALPIFILYKLSYKDRFSITFSNIYILIILLSSAMSADRRILFYYIISFIIIKFYQSNKKVNYKNYLYVAIIMLLLPLLYLRRFDGDFYEFSKVLGFVFLQSSLGALGISAILPEVKHIVESNTGFLYGKSFYIYIVTLFIPSVLIYFLGGSEFYFRSSLYFNEIFNDNPNMGYDFMMIADFYWNFGYFGYFLYLIIFSFIIYFGLVAAKKNNVKYQGLFILLLVFFIAGQRSDFGLFLKSFSYSAIIFYFLYKFLPKKIS